MGYFDAQFITDKGTELLARSTAGEGDIIFTSMHTGDGEYSLGEISSITSVDGLKDEKGIFPVNDVDSNGENTRVRAAISNQGLEEGYYLKEIGLYAKMEDEAEVLFSISVCREKPTFLPEMQDVPIELPVTNYVSYSGDGNFTLEYRSDVYATLDMVQRLSFDIQNDIKTVKEGILNTIQEEMDTHTNSNAIHLTESDRQQFFRGNADWGWRNPEWTEDIDGWVLPGCYGVSATCTHLPPNIAEPWGNLLVFPSMEGRILQMYYDWNDPDKVYHRVINGTTASNWMLFADDMYGICTTDANESTMEISSDLSYARRHQKMTIYFVNGCNAGTKYLKINGQTAIRMYCQGGDLSHNIPRGSFVEVIFIDGAAYLIESKSDDMLQWKGLGSYMPNASCDLPSSFKELEVVVRHRPNNRIYTGRIRRYTISSSEMNWLLNGHYYNSNDYGSINIAISAEKIRAVYLTYKGSLVDMSSGEYDYSVSYR